MICTFFLW